MTRQMLLGSDGLGQSGELLGSQHLWKLAIGRGRHHSMASDWALSWLSSPLFPAMVPWASSLWTTLPLWLCFFLGPQSPSSAFQYWSGAWKHWARMKPPWVRPFLGPKLFFCLLSLSCSLYCAELRSTWSCADIVTNARTGCGRGRRGCIPGTASPAGLGGSVSEVSENLQGASLNITGSNKPSRIWKDEAEGC